MNVVLFFTHGVSLREWSDIGMLQREVAIYRKLVERGVGMTFVTYGDASDAEYAGHIPEIRICPNRLRLPIRLYAILCPLLHAGALHRADLIKCNQMPGATTALRAARLWRKPMIARCGYMWSQFAGLEHGDDSLLARYARSVERRVCSSSDRVVVTTEGMKEALLKLVPDAANRIRIIPNYVDDRLFAPSQPERQDVDVIYVGRLHQQKNLASLIEACRSVDGLRLSVVGNGPLFATLRKMTSDFSTRVSWHPLVPHGELPAHLNGARVFVLPSLYEGHPKSLLEAMSCGMPVIGADSPGIRELIHHGETGWLCGTSPDAIREAIRRVLGDAALREKLGRNARRFVIDHAALNMVVGMELQVYGELIRKQ